MSKILIANKAQCPKCLDVIESKHVHDFVSCGCGYMHVDGGLEYLKRGWEKEWLPPIELSEYREEGD